MSVSPSIRSTDDRQIIQWLGRTRIDVLVDAAASGGQCSVIDVRAEEGDAAPLHVHSREEEMFIVVDGAVTIWVGDERHDLTAGGVAVLPRDIPHAFRVTVDGTRMINVSTPGGFEGFFRSVGHEGTAPADWTVDRAALARAGAAYGAPVLGPPPDLADPGR
jgi:quercetin dioxygenase-like cupin family protein